jgi:hypothetical protein
MIMYEEQCDQKGAGADANWLFLRLFNLFIGSFLSRVSITSETALYINIILILYTQLLPSDFKFLNQGISISKKFFRSADHLDYFNPLTTTQVILI